MICQVTILLFLRLFNPVFAAIYTLKLLMVSVSAWLELVFEGCSADRFLRVEKFLFHLDILVFIRAKAFFTASASALSLIMHGFYAVSILECLQMPALQSEAGPSEGLAIRFLIAKLHCSHYAE